jgi:hypothetical protein
MPAMGTITMVKVVITTMATLTPATSMMAMKVAMLSVTRPVHGYGITHHLTSKLDPMTIHELYINCE